MGTEVNKAFDISLCVLGVFMFVWAGFVSAYDCKFLMEHI